MPVWGWALLIAFLSALAVGAVMAIVRATHRLPESEPLHGDHRDYASPMPHHVAEADGMTARELEEEQARSDGAISRDR